MAPFLKVSVAAAMTIFVASAAQAFTFQDSGDGGKSGAGFDDKKSLPPYTDPARRLDQSDERGNSAQFGSGTVTFGPRRSFDDEFATGKERLFSPFSRDR
jgi:hypothetical protein